MSVDYAAGLSHCDDLGVCGLDEVFDKPEDVDEKVKTLASWLRHYDGSCVVHVGAGLSTSAGIRDFRGKRGVWTEMLRGSGGGQNSSGKAEISNADSTVKQETLDGAGHVPLKPFDETTPTFSHMALKSLCESSLVQHIISQNVDGLFLKANLSRLYISELHGNFYLDECTRCRSRFVRSTASQTMRLQRSSTKCPRSDVKCKGYLRDTILDWESRIPSNELRIASREAKKCKLHICIGTSLQLSPSKDIVCKGGCKAKKLVIINLQPTKFDANADMVIHYYADSVMRRLVGELKINVPEYDISCDPTKTKEIVGSVWRRWP